MSKSVGIRLSDDEARLLTSAMDAEKQPGDRGGLATFIRRAALRDAERLLAAEPPSPPRDTEGR